MLSYEPESGSVKQLWCGAGELNNRQETSVSCWKI